jgi:hypothetical protein
MTPLRRKLCLLLRYHFNLTQWLDIFANDLTNETRVTSLFGVREREGLQNGFWLGGAGKGEKEIVTCFLTKGNYYFQ